MKPRIKYAKLDPHSFPEARELADLVGKFIEFWGFKAVQGRIWCYLYLSSRPLHSRELAQLAKVSPALITQSVKVLLDYRVILEAGKGPNGMLFFKANPNAAAAVAEVLAGREARLLKKIETAAIRLSEAPLPPKNHSSIDLDRDHATKITQWIGIASSLLGSGLSLLREDENPFSHPEHFQPEAGTLPGKRLK